MSVGMYILNAQTESEKLFYVPVSSESFFTRVWREIALELDLKWIPLFQFGVKIRKCDLKPIFNELDHMIKFADENLENDFKNHLITRIDLAKTKLTELYDEKDYEVYIG